MYSPEFTHLQAELSRKMNAFLKAFQTAFFNNIVDDKIERNFIKEMEIFYNCSDEGKVLQEAEKAFEAFKGKMLA